MQPPPTHLVRPTIAGMQGYVPGEQPREPGFTKLNTNESPYPPSPRVVERLRQACGDDLRLYPDPAALGVRQRLAQIYSVTPEETIVGNGSDELLNLVMRAFVDPGQVVAYPQPTYSYYQQLVQIQGGRAVTVDFPEDYALPEEVLVPGAQVTLLANPNAPSGTLTPLSRIEALAARVEGILVVDEAYVDFAAAGCVHLVRQHPRTVVLRTMSKSFSLAGMRIGFGFAHPALIASMWKVKDHYNVNRLSLAAAEAALDDIGLMRERAALIAARRDRLTAALRGLGFHVWESAANFVLARIAAPPASLLYAELKQRRILVRHFDQPRLRDCLRISVGTQEEQDRLLAELEDLLGHGPGLQDRLR
ncbi:MAG: histidinol-phosphate transaminase [Candidatus Latescibacterota bacterium]